jgi:hypothetical protein
MKRSHLIPCLVAVVVAAAVLVAFGSGGLGFAAILLVCPLMMLGMMAMMMGNRGTQDDRERHDRHHVS